MIHAARIPVLLLVASAGPAAAAPSAVDATEVVRARAAQDLECEAERVVVRARGERFSARGCGGYASYQARADGSVQLRFGKYPVRGPLLERAARDLACTEALEGSVLLGRTGRMGAHVRGCGRAASYHIDNGEPELVVVKAARKEE